MPEPNHQPPTPTAPATSAAKTTYAASAAPERLETRRTRGAGAVSYTHLTLPTSDLV